MSAKTLHELQFAFAECLLGQPNGEIEALVDGGGLDAGDRLRIYRNIVFNNLTGALATAYPAVKALVGEAFFDAACARYIRQYPSTSGKLQEYGARFADLLAKMPEAASLAYLPNVARLEWLRQQSALAPLASPGDSLPLADPAPQRCDALRLELHPSLGLLASDYPVLDIWLYCQAPQEDRLNIDGGGQCVAVWRSGAEVAMLALDPARYRFISALRHGARLGEAQAATMQEHADFDPAPALAWLFAEHLVVSITD